MHSKKSENTVVNYNTTFISDLNNKHIVEFPTQTLTKANKATFRKKVEYHKRHRGRIYGRDCADDVSAAHTPLSMPNPSELHQPVPLAESWLNIHLHC